MSTARAGLTWGFCVVCTEYGKGRFAHVIDERSDAIDEHEGCKGGRPPAVEQPRRHHAER